jgi:putrescine transport system ATP-binding protein
VRPERMSLSRTEPKTAGRRQGRVLEAGYLGDRTIYVVETAPGTTIRIAQSNRPGERATAGDTVWAGWPAEAEMNLQP